MRPYELLLHVVFWLCLVFTVALAAGCSSEDGDRDLAGALTGPAIEVHCAGLDRTPRAGIGDTQSTVNCAQATP